jgi:hypothetical protein
MTIEGQFRSEVEILNQADEVILRHQFVQMALPKAWVEKQPEFKRLLLSELSVKDLQTSDLQVQSVLFFLQTQDFFFKSKAKSNYTLKEIRGLFESISRTWYAQYYQHPLWESLRSSSLSLNGFVAWIIHNYHVSRAAGLSGARCATRFSKVEKRPCFRQDVLEEYWHCDAYYFVRHPNLQLSDESIKTYIPLPASLAFEQHTLRVAESDWLGHLLISYFQESSIRFYDECLEFYQQVETAYDLPGFFKSWQAHMALDLEHGHAEHFIEHLNTDEIVSHQDFMVALQNAWLAFFYLLTSLDQIQAESIKYNQVELRAPSSTTQALVLNKKLELSSPYFRDRLLDSIYCALSNARTHDEILLWGHAAKDLEQQWTAQKSLFNSELPEDPIEVAIANMLWRASTHTSELASLLILLIANTVNSIPISPSTHLLLQQHSATVSKVVDLKTLALQFVELLTWRNENSMTIPNFNI